MKRVRAFFAFLYDFIVGDDPLPAIVVPLALALTALLVHNDVNAWWLMPIVGAGLLWASVARATR